MKRMKTKIPDAIIISDLHLSDSTPSSRVDNYIEAQKEKLLFIQELSNKYNKCPILCAGDVFDYWKASPWLCHFALKYLPQPLITIAGQHDLPLHSLESYEKSALSLIESIAENIIVLKEDAISLQNNLHIIGRSFGVGDSKNLKPDEQGKRNILMIHDLIWQNNRPEWDKGHGTDIDILKRYGKEFDLIITGDNHKPYVTEYENSILVNPGSMLRKNIDQVEHLPRCYLYYADTNSVESIYLPIKKNVHSQDHVKKEKGKDERILAYIQKMKNDKQIGLSFKNNLNIFFKENNTPKKVREIIWQSISPI